VWEKKQWEDYDEEGEEYRQNYKMNYAAKYFQPTVVNQVRKAFPQKDREYEDDDYRMIEEYEICFDNRNNRERKVQVIMDFVRLSRDAALEVAEDDDVVSKSDFEKEKHLTPLEESLTKSIDAANAVMKELKHIGEREARMRQVSDKINTRVQMFSILSVVVLMGVSYIQISYLHRFFHKRKLL